MSQSLEKKFEDVLKKDKSKHIKPFMVSWDYQERRKIRRVKYAESVVQDFYAFLDPAEIVKWMNWFGGEYPNFYPSEVIDPLVEQSKKNDQKIFAKLGISYDFANYHNIGLNNAHDFFIPQSYPVPPEFAIKNVLDFGAGYGRQANLWWPHLNGKGNFIAVDAIPASYSLQNHYYSAIKPDFKEYLLQPDQFNIDSNGSELYHLPTWRLDLVPDNSVDLILCVQVLPELSKELILYLFKHFHRILKPGAALYLRDLNYLYKAFGTLNIDKALSNAGFTLEFRAFIEHDKHLHGIPKIWRKNITQINVKQKVSWSQKKRFMLEDLDLFRKKIFPKK